MKRLALTALVFAALASPAHAKTTMDAILANTLTTQGADGATTRWHFNADGTFRMTAPNGQAGTGTYTSDASKFCVTPQGGQQACVAPAPEGKGVGDSWQTKDAGGNAVTVSIVAGR